MEFIEESNKEMTANVDKNAQSETLKENEDNSSSLTRGVGVGSGSGSGGAKNTPTLAQIGRQVSLNLRNSQLYDSGAESCCDNDEQSRLLRSASIRSQPKFLIIPATAASSDISPNTGGELSPTLRQTISASALNAMAAAMQPKPMSATTGGMRNKPQRPLSTASTSSTFRLLSPLSGTLSDASDIDETNNLHSRSATISADVVHQSHIPAAISSGVRFTLNEDNINLEPTTSTKTTTTAEINNTAATNNNNTITHNPQNMPSNVNYQTSSSSSTLKPTANESMRSAASANALSASYQPSQFLQPTNFLDSGRKELSASACLFPDQLPNQIYSDLTSVRSLASIGIGSTDGRRLVIRRVPTTPNELFSLVHPATTR